MNTLELNIRLDAGGPGETLSVIARRQGKALSALERIGNVRYRRFDQGRISQLIVEVSGSVPDTLVYRLARDLKQDGIAVYCAGTGQGKLIGPRAKLWVRFRLFSFERFDPALTIRQKVTQDGAIKYRNCGLHSPDSGPASDGHLVTTIASDETSSIAARPPCRALSKQTMNLRSAYEAALYEFEANGQSYVLRVGEQCMPAIGLLRSRNAAGAAFITACNPASLQLGPVHNNMADIALKRDLAKRGALVFSGAGKDSSGVWPPEPSLLAIGIERLVAEKLARQYGQYAMLWIDATGLVELVEIFDLKKAARFPLKVPPFATVELGFNWCGERFTLRLNPAKWLKIIKGEYFRKTSTAYFEGDSFKLNWEFRNGTYLYVSYGNNRVTFYDGNLSGVFLNTRDS